MKTNIKLYLFLTLALIGLNSCLSEDPVFDPTGGKMGIVEFGPDIWRTSSSMLYPVKVTTLELVDEIILPVEINVTGWDGVAADVQVTIAIDDEAVRAYNTYHKLNPAYQPLDPSLYEIPTTTLSIPKGQKTAVVNIKLKPRLFDMTKLYAIGVSIKSVTGDSNLQISGNFSTCIYALPVKSPFDGTYNVHYKWITRGGATPPASDVEYDETNVTVKTYGLGVVETQYVGAYYSGTTRYTFNADGTIGVYVDSGGARAVEVFDSHYDTETGNFMVDYSFISPASYRIVETYTKIK